MPVSPVVVRWFVAGFIAWFVGKSISEIHMNKLSIFYLLVLPYKS